jgi:uncharacterized protein YfkK (UPF0435 family)
MVAKQENKNRRINKLNIYLGKIKDSFHKLESILMETEKLSWELEQIKNTLKIINDDLEADEYAEDAYHNNNNRLDFLKSKEVSTAFEAVKENNLKPGEQRKYFEGEGNI